VGVRWPASLHAGGDPGVVSIAPSANPSNYFPTTARHVQSLGKLRGSSMEERHKSVLNPRFST
jgi:hypothetical protein